MTINADTSINHTIRVSAIVSAYNSELYMSGCLENLTQQTLFAKGELEIVIIDSGSEQNEADIVKEFQRNHPDRIIYQRTNRETLYAAWNRGIELSRGEYLTNANTDDRHRIDALEIMANTLDQQPEFDLVYGDCHVSAVPNETFKNNAKTKVFKYPDFFAPSALLHYQFGPQPMWRKSTHQKIGYFDPTFGAAGDYDFNIRFAMKCKALHIPEILGLYLAAPTAISFRDKKMEKENSKISTSYQTLETVEQLYKAAGFPSESNTEKARLYLDMGNRASEFYTPWGKGETEQNSALAKACFQRAAELAPDWQTAGNNLAVSLYQAGNTDQAIELLELISSIRQNHVVTVNLDKMKNPTQQKTDLTLLDSGLAAPCQKQLAAGTPVTSYSLEPTLKFRSGTQRETEIQRETIGTILLVCHGFPPAQIGGTQLYVQALARQLHQSGYLVRVLFPKCDTINPTGHITEYTDQGLLIAELSIQPEKRPLDLGQLEQRFCNRETASAFKNFLARSKPDLIHFHHMIGISGTALESAHELDIPTVLTLHDGWFFCDQYHFIRPDGSFCESGPQSTERCAICHAERNGCSTAGSSLVSQMETRKKYLSSVLRFADTIIVPSNYLFKKLSKHGLSHPHILINPLGLCPTLLVTRKRAPDKVRFAYLGHILPVKGLDILLRAVNLLSSNQAQVDIYGQTLDTNYFTTAVNALVPGSPVQYHGTYAPKDLPAILAQIDVAVIPSRTESFCFTLRECLQAGIPVLASDSGALPEVIVDGENGLLFEAGNHFDLAKKMNSIMETPGKLEALSAAIKPLKLIEQECLEIAEIYSMTIARKAGNTTFSTTPCETSPFNTATRLIAFHLPQYHPIPENDEWWGEGFTEWTNVRQARPLFPGHYQPHEPTELGYYDLRNSAALVAQAVLAQEHGIHGFCYYHYWFNGKLLLETPVHEMLKSGEPDFPFCLCWANEDWTRAWDGRSGEILIGQNYSDEDDIRHFHYLRQFFEDKRYIRIDGKPLFLIYRANKLPDPLKTTTRWRELAKKSGIGEVYLCRVESFADEHTNPHPSGFDAAVEFQPDWRELGDKLIGEGYGDHRVYDYPSIVQNMISKPNPGYMRFPCVTPSWDNSPRRKSGAVILQNSSPAHYKSWLEYALTKVQAVQKEERIVFINAWNEWGEGNYLEPDQKHGRAYLEATKAALSIFEVNNEISTKGELNLQKKSPLVSVIIPVCNKLEYTHSCLKAIFQNTHEITYEIVLIDNNSTDGTKNYLQELKNHINVLTNNENIGYTIACNQGAAAAIGKYLVFLNNDTEPQQGWLDALVKLAERDPLFGAIGAKLVYPDGKLQEAGAIVFNDGTALNFGRGDDPGKAIYNNVQEVDYCSGACLLVRRDIFAEAGGFDERFAPGYYEETDLCFSLRKLGYKVLYCPSSEVIHHGSVTAGLDPNSGLRKYLQINKGKFIEKWRIELSEHIPSTTESKFQVTTSDRVVLKKNFGDFLNNFQNIGKKLVIGLHAQTLNHPEGIIAGSEITTQCLMKAFLKNPSVQDVKRYGPGNYSTLTSDELDLVVIEGWDPSIPSFIAHLRQQKPDCLIFFWNLSFLGFEEVLTLDVDGYFTNSQKNLKLLQAIKPSRFVMLSADPQEFSPTLPSPEYQHNVVYLGMYHPHKSSDIIERILCEATEFGLAIYGNRWDEHPYLSKYWKGRLPMGHISRLYSSAKVILGTTEDRQRSAGMINNRPFEALSCGSCFLSEFYPELEETFGDTMLYSRQKGDTARLLREMLQDNSSRRDIGARGRALILTRHTYELRIQEMLDLFFKIRSGKEHITPKQSPVVELEQKQHDTPLISILIPTYNRALYIRDAIQSALMQTYQNFELIVVDDGSSDETPDTVKKFSDRRVRYVRKEHSGAPATRNRCIREAKGEFLVWLDSDDMLEPDVLTSYADALAKSPDADVLYGDLIVTDAHFRPTSGVHYQDWYDRNGDLLANLLHSNCIPNPGTMVRKSLYEKLGMYNESFRRAHDYELWTRFALKATFKRLPIKVVKWRWHDSNMSSGSVQYDTSFDARIIHSMLETYALSELFPTMDWRGKDQDKIFASVYLIIAQRLLNLKDVSGACVYLEKSHAVVPNPNTLQLRDNLLSNKSQTEPSVAPLGSNPVPANQGPTTTFFSEKNFPVSAPINDTKPLVSVIVPTHNRPELLEKALRSIQDQTFRDFEIIVVNDAGIDVSRLVEHFNSRGTIRYINKKTNEGLAAARNSGIRAARGKYIAYLDDDDTYYPDHLQTLVDYLENSDAPIAYSDAQRVLQEQKGESFTTVNRDIPYSEEFDAERLLVENYIPVLCFMHEKQCLDQAGLFDESLPRHEDWDLWIRLSQKFPFIHIPKITAEFTHRITDPSGMTSGTLPSMLVTLEKIYEKSAPLAGTRPLVIARRKSYLFDLKNRIHGFLQDKLKAISDCPENDPELRENELIERLRKTGATRNQILAAYYHKLGLPHISGDPATALAHFSRALAADPVCCPVHRNIAETMLQIGEIEQAVRHCEVIISQEPNDPALIDLVADMTRRLGNRDKAEFLEEKARNLRRTMHAA